MLPSSFGTDYLCRGTRRGPSKRPTLPHCHPKSKTAVIISNSWPADEEASLHLHTVVAWPQPWAALSPPFILLHIRIGCVCPLRTKMWCALFHVLLTHCIFLPDRSNCTFVVSGTNYGVPYYPLFTHFVTSFILNPLPLHSTQSTPFHCCEIYSFVPIEKNGKSFTCVYFEPCVCR